MPRSAFAIVLVSGTFALTVPQPSSAATAISAPAKYASCEREATLQLYTGRERSKFVRRCLANYDNSVRRAWARPEPRVHPSGRAAVTRPSPLGTGNPPSTSTGSTAPSNAATAPSNPVVGSSGNSTTGSSASSISGSSGSSLGSSPSLSGSTNSGGFSSRSSSGFGGSLGSSTTGSGLGGSSSSGSSGGL